MTNESTAIFKTTKGNKPKIVLYHLRAGTSNHVHPIDVQAAESLYLSLCERSNDQHMLLVVYAPWCPHSRAVEHEVSCHFSFV